MSQRSQNNLTLIKLGRIGKAVESKMGVALANDVNIYLHSTMADAYAREFPETYLSLLEEAANIIRKPDAISYDSKTEVLSYVRLLPREGELFLLRVCVAHIGSPQKWVVRQISAYKNLKDLANAESHYARI